MWVPIVIPSPAALFYAELDTDNQSGPALQSSELVVTAALQNGSVVYSKRSWNGIGTPAAKKQLKTFHTQSHCNKTRARLPKGETHVPITRKHLTEAKRGEYFIDIAVPTSTDYLAEHAIIRLALLWKAMYLVSLFRDIDFRILVQEQWLGHGMPFAAYLHLVNAISSYNIRRAHKDVSSNHDIFRPRS